MIVAPVVTLTLLSNDVACVCVFKLNSQVCATITTVTLEYFHRLKRNPALQLSLPLPPPPQPPAPTSLLSVPLGFPILDAACEWNT